MRSLFIAAIFTHFCAADTARAITIEAIDPCPGRACEPITFEPKMTILGIWRGLANDGTGLLYEDIRIETESFQIIEGAVTQSAGRVPVGTPLDEITPDFVDVAGENFIYFSLAGIRVGIDFELSQYDVGVGFFARGLVTSRALERRGIIGQFYTDPGIFDDSPLPFRMYFVPDPTNVALPPMAGAFALSALALLVVGKRSSPKNDVV